MGFLFGSLLPDHPAACTVSWDSCCWHIVGFLGAQAAQTQEDLWLVETELKKTVFKEAAAQKLEDVSHNLLEKL